MTFIQSIAEVVRMQRRRFQQVLGKHDVPLHRAAFGETTPDTLVPPKVDATVK